MRAKPGCIGVGIQRVNTDKFRALRSNDLDPKAESELTAGPNIGPVKLANVKSQNHGLMLVSLFVLGLTLFRQGSYEILCRIIFQ